MMNQVQFAEGPPVPMMIEGIIDRATLLQFSSDIRSAARLISVREKCGPDALAGPDGQSLESAIERLLTGVARAIQVRYHYDGHDWSDTIVAMPAGFRVVRCRHE
jgi:hypothetical protein